MQIVVFVEDKCLIAVLEYREIFELFQEPWDVILVDKEACEKHEWNNEDGGQRHCKLLV